MAKERQELISEIEITMRAINCVIYDKHTPLEFLHELIEVLDLYERLGDLKKQSQLFNDEPSAEESTQAAP